jgi:ABC-type glutathione transport system ATPase component
MVVGREREGPRAAARRRRSESAGRETPSRGAAPARTRRSPGVRRRSRETPPAGGKSRARTAPRLAEVGLAAARTSARPSFPAAFSSARSSRALILEAALAFARERAGNPDSGSCAEVFALLRRIREEVGASVLVVTHDPRLARRCGRIVDGSLAPDSEI